MEKEIKRAKRDVWLYRYFGREIPIESLKYVIKCQCCSKEFLEKFVIEYHLPQAFEMMLLEEYAQKDEQLVAAYIRRFGCCKNVGHHMLVALSGSSFLYDTLCQVIPVDRDAQLAFFKGLKDKNDRLKFISKYGDSFCDPLVEYLLQMQDYELFSAYASFHSRIDSLTSYQESLIVRSKNLDMFKKFIIHFKVTKRTLDDLIADENISYLQEYLYHNKFSESIQTELAQAGNKKILALYIRMYPLCDDALYALIDKDYKDILKLHYLKHGINKHVLAYQANLANFKAYIGLDENQ